MKMTRRQFILFTGALGLSSCARVKVPLIGTGEKAPFTVAAMNDLHVKDAHSTAFVNHAIEKINATQNLRFVAVLGDLSTSGQLSELNLAKTSLDRLAKPCLTLPGNHDVQGNGPDVYANFEKVFGPTQWIREEGDWLFIGLNSCEGALSDVTIAPDRISWLRKQINKIKPGRPIALFAHHPFNPNTKKYRVKNTDEVLGLFSGHNLKLVAAGHWHGNQVTVCQQFVSVRQTVATTNCEEHDGILFTTTACCTSTRENFDETTAKGYRLFHFDRDKVETEFVEVAV